MTIGQRIRATRVEHGWSQGQLAQRCRVSRAAVSQWEADETVPTGPNLVRLSRELAVNGDWLVTGKGAPSDQGPIAAPVHYGFLRAYLRESGANLPMIASRIGAKVAEVEEFLAGRRTEVGAPAHVRVFVDERFSRTVPEDLRGAGSPGEGNARPSTLLPPARLEMLKDIPVYGTAACGDEGAFHLNTGDPIDWARRPLGIAHTRNVYAIYVEGDSMLPAFRPGALVYVDPNRKPTIGADVVIQVPARRDGDGPVCYLKRLVKRTAREYIAEQFNPAREIRYPIDAIVHRVLTLEELLGI
jgi:phage repressor protein C with HTH and peptisase S24 domain